METGQFDSKGTAAQLLLQSMISKVAGAATHACWKTSHKDSDCMLHSNKVARHMRAHHDGGNCQ